MQKSKSMDGKDTLQAQNDDNAQDGRGMAWNSISQVAKKLNSQGWGCDSSCRAPD